MLIPFFVAVSGASSLASLAPPPTEYLASTLTADPSVLSTGPATAQQVELSAAEFDAALAYALAWCSTHGLLVHASGDSVSKSSSPSSAPRLVHAPFSLLPAPFPKEQLAFAAGELASLFGLLVDRVGRDVPWLAQTLRLTAESDEFTRRLLELCEEMQREGATQHARLALLRSDYMLHEPEGVSSAGGQLLQVELNTIASSFGSLASRVCDLHAVLAQRFPAVRRSVWSEAGQPPTLSLPATLPRSQAIEELAGALADAHAEYGVADAALLLVVQPGERNAIDQELLCERLWVAHGVPVIRRTLAALAQEAHLEGPERRLRLGSGVECSVVYFRCGYTPDDYPTDAQWDARRTLERSHAIKCPCIEHHLVGCKKVQQQLSQPGELERFLSDAEAATVRRVFAGLWALSGPTEPAADAPADELAAAEHMRRAIENPSEYVMKPQREGGGHNLFGAELSAALQSLSREERSAFILMQRILPRRRSAILVRDGETTVGPAVSELGIYSTLLTGKGGDILRNQAAGHLVRTKLDGVDEGGVAAGFAVLSSPLAALPLDD